MPEPIDDRKGFTSASSAEADVLCPGRFLAQRGLPDLDENAKIRDEGTKVHKLVQEGKAEEHEGAASIEEKEEDAVLSWTKLLNIPDIPLKTIREKRFWLRDEKRKPYHSGQPDVVYLTSRYALILDYKSVQWAEHTDPTKNGQLLDYAVLVYQGYPMLESITVAIVQPGHLKPHLVTYEEQDLVEATALVKARIAASNNSDSPRVPGPKQCRYCRAKMTCPAIAQDITEVAVEFMGKIDLATVPPVKIVKLYKACTMAADLHKSLKYHIRKTLAETPGAIPGMSLGEPSSNRSLEDADPQQIADALQDIPVTAILSAATIGVTKLEKAVRGALPLEPTKGGKLKPPTFDKTREYMEGKLGDLLKHKPKERKIIVDGDLLEEDEENEP